MAVLVFLPAATGARLIAANRRDQAALELGLRLLLPSFVRRGVGDVADAFRTLFQDLRGLLNLFARLNLDIHEHTGDFVFNGV